MGEFESVLSGTWVNLKVFYLVNHSIALRTISLLPPLTCTSKPNSCISTQPEVKDKPINLT